MLSLLMDPLFAPRAFWRRPLSVGTRPTVMTCKKPVPKNRVSQEIDPDSALLWHPTKPIKP
jgi:hypothetical protein